MSDGRHKRGSKAAPARPKAGQEQPLNNPAQAPDQAPRTESKAPPGIPAWWWWNEGSA